MFRKYEFSDLAQFETYKAQITDEEGNYTGCAVHEIGQICFASDEEGNCTDLSPFYAVDIYWSVEPPADFTAFEVWPAPCGVHTFAGLDWQYLKDYCERFPDSPHCVIPEELP